MSKKIFLRTFGCQMNDRDSEFVMGLLLEKGYLKAESPEEADVVLFNTCSVRKHAEDRAISNMGAFLKKKRRHLKIYGIIGCSAQALKKGLFERLPDLDLICGTGEIAKLPELIVKAFQEKIIAVGNINRPLPELKSTYRQGKKSTHVSIMRGCDNFCSYCVVPYVRGRERSRKAEDITSEIKDLVRRGIKDIMLLGQNVNSYKDKTCNFVELLKLVNDVKGIEKITFFTSHPKDATVKLFEAIRDLDKVRKHLHLPLQSGSNRILKLMNRGYTREKYLDLVTRAKHIIPGLFLGTDMIVGFPSESDKDFNDTLDLVKKVRFDGAYIFKYSPRAGTGAAGMKDEVSEDTKKRRHRTLLDLQREISKRKKHEKADRCHASHSLSR
ncbi:MAG: tRNA (N6-isopentenyl adenosine(37)-C2)-methylthiotransferase MiaB [Candidatus Omnitrophica bacterium]|nr:tRNA (N6-isopentenyl adenosine(37)-C2)-methylthiotransferase MiaB [Candidatus Omnitrophota bacterium]